MIIIKCDVKDCKVEYAFNSYITRSYGEEDNKITISGADIKAIFEKLPGQRYAQNKQVVLCVEHDKQLSQLTTDLKAIQDKREKSILGIKEEKPEAVE